MAELEEIELTSHYKKKKKIIKSTSIGGTILTEN